MTSQLPVQVFIEAGRKRVFASALDWPGWSRSGRTEELAVEALADYLLRYSAVVRRAGLAGPVAEFTIVEREPGVARKSDFGALGSAATSEHRPMTGAEGRRLAALLEAAWAELAQAAADAPAVLPKGPRGGGRDRDAIIAHVVESEVVYARKMGIRLPRPRPEGDAETATLRSAVVAAIEQGAAGTPAVPNGWPPRYAVRRIGWHVLDHAWELRDKSGPATG